MGYWYQVFDIRGSGDCFNMRPFVWQGWLGRLIFFVAFCHAPFLLAARWSLHFSVILSLYFSSYVGTGLDYMSWCNIGSEVCSFRKHFGFSACINNLNYAYQFIWPLFSALFALTWMPLMHGSMWPVYWWTPPGKDHEWCVRQFDMGVDEQSLPKIASDICEHLTWVSWEVLKHACWQDVVTVVHIWLNC